MRLYSGLSNRFSWMQGMYPLNGHELLLFKTSVSFIDHLQEFLSSILTACVLVIPPFNELKENLYSIIDFLQAYFVNRLTTVPSLMKTILPGLKTNANMRVENSLKLLVLSGETFPLTLWEMLSTLLPKTSVLNLYGSTETKVSGDCTYFDCKRMPFIFKEERLTSVPIGLPIPNCDVILLSENGASNEGELYVGGPCIFRGYYNESKEMSDAFAKLLPRYSCDDFVNESSPVSPSGKVNYELLVGSTLLTKNVKDKLGNIDCSNLLQLIKKAFHDALMIEKVCDDDDFFTMVKKGSCSLHDSLDSCLQINTDRQDNHISNNCTENYSPLESRMTSKDNDDSSSLSKRLKRGSTDVTSWGDESFPWYSPLLSFSFNRCNKVLHKGKQEVVDMHQKTWSADIPRGNRGHMKDFWKVTWILVLMLHQCLYLKAHNVIFALDLTLINFSA
ncbi:putative acyl-activating enzyme 19 [Phaseolus vulgaris]|uniref:putative acyl-activating enzyme 19 n=1 Tax=Phaseolus vulgaris TaxID=3885 RepID=UPI0035CC0F7E